MDLKTLLLLQAVFQTIKSLKFNELMLLHLFDVFYCIIQLIGVLFDFHLDVIWAEIVFVYLENTACHGKLQVALDSEAANCASP